MRKILKVTEVILIFVPLLITLPLYSMAYVISKKLKLKDYENMPTPSEYIDVSWYIEEET